MEMTFAHDCIILDASCIINLYASGQMTNILRSIPRSVAVAAVVAHKETLWIYSGPDEDVRQNKQKIELHPFIEAGLIKVVNLASEAEIIAYVDFTLELDDGEATTAAIALHRNWAIAVDEKKARVLLQRQAVQLQVIYALELVKHWVDTMSPSFETVSLALKRIHKRAVYKPGQSHPLYPWWTQYTQG